MSKLEKLSKDEYLKLFDKSVRGHVEMQMDNPGTTHHVYFENMQMDSSQFGFRSGLSVGDCWSTLKSLKDLYTESGSLIHLHDLPSQRQYPTKYREKGQ